MGPDAVRGLRRAVVIGGIILLPVYLRGGGEMILAQMAQSYRRNGDLIRLRVIALTDASRTATGTEKLDLEHRIRELNVLYRETVSMASFLEHYYDRREAAENE